ncbi:DUF5053 domain-containing protein [uncultured Porphyromonas sp.]|uniref:DUF5053 domain-containing protein n=1 Tax=uncultured Porphyromonas sp. TaxID=159274 RepID=UPI00260F204A|nr:DUF5053 domain-containing protein [uncultured Porphyromonas sp.]
MTMSVSVHMPVKEATEQCSVKEKVSDILLDISWRGLARRYFGKSSSWMYHKMDGIYGGLNAGFTEQEQAELKGALCDLADRIRRCADAL